MIRSFSHLVFTGVLILVLSWGLPHVGTAQDAPSKNSSPSTKEAPYVPTPQHVVFRMLELADVSEDDVVYDLGSGDGRIVIAAAKEFGARGVGIEIDSQLVEQARNNARRADVEDQVEFRRRDLFEADFSEATVVTMYLWPTMTDRLRPKLRNELSPGTRVVSHDFEIEGWTPDTTTSIGNNTLQESATELHFWTVPQ